MFVDQLYIYRRLNLLGALVAAMSVTVSQVYLKEILGGTSLIFSLTCVLNIALFTAFGLAFMHHPRPAGQKIYAFLSLMLAISGILTIGLHLWNRLQNQFIAEDCSISFLERVGDDGFINAVMSLYSSAAHCSEPSWHFANLSITELALVNLSLCLVISWKLIRQPTKSRSLFK